MNIISPLAISAISTIIEHGWKLLVDVEDSRPFGTIGTWADFRNLTAHREFFLEQAHTRTKECVVAKIPLFSLISTQGIGRLR